MPSFSRRVASHRVLALFQRLLARLFGKGLHPGESFLGGHDQAAEPQIVARHHPAQDDNQVLEAVHRLGCFNAHDAAFSANLPAAGRPGNHQVPGLRIDEHVLDSPQASQILHLLGRPFSGGRAKLELFFQPRQRYLSERRIAACVEIAAGRRLQAAQSAQPIAARLDGQLKRSVGIDIDAGGNGAIEPGPPRPPSSPAEWSK